jgi:hypothetical protein
MPRSLKPFSKLDLGELTVSAEFGKVDGGVIPPPN